MYHIEHAGTKATVNGIPLMGADSTGVIKRVDLDKRLLDMVGSTEQMDRDGDCISMSGWKMENYTKNPVFLWAHDYASVPLASTSKIVKKKTPFPHLLFKDIRYPRAGLFPFADMILELYGEKIINASSVGFLPYKWEDAEQKAGEEALPWTGRKYTSQELLELSGCAVPSNPGALQLALEPFAKKQFGKIPGSELTKYIMKGELLVPDHTDDILNDLNVKAIVIEEEGPKVHQVHKDTPGIETKVIEEEEAGVQAKGIILDKAGLNVDAHTAFKNIDVAAIEVPASSYLYDIYSKFIGADIKNIYQRDICIPHPMIGTYMFSLKAVFEKMKPQNMEIRNFTGGGECPPGYDDIQLNSEKSIETMVYGSYFSKIADQHFVLRLQPAWEGLFVTLYCSLKDKDFSKGFFDDLNKTAAENNFLKGERFSLTGDFLEKGEAKWEDLILDQEIVTPIKRNVEMLKKNGQMKSRGIMAVGKPGTGKTLTGKTIKDNTDFTFIWVSSRDLTRIRPVSAVKMAYRMGRQLAPAVLFIEDIDGWMDGTVVDVFKTEMDGIESNKGILTILTSNNPKNFPVSLIDRPGRFHEVLVFDLPTKEIRGLMLKKWVTEPLEEKAFDEVVEKTAGFSGAHMKELVDLAELMVSEEGLELNEAIVASLDKIIAQRQLVRDLPNYDTFENDEPMGKAIKLEQQENISAKNNPDSEFSALAIEDLTGGDDLHETILFGEESVPAGKEKQVDESVEGLQDLIAAITQLKILLNK